MAKQKTKRNKKIIELVKKGKSYNTIARFYNLTPQRIQQIIKSYPQETVRTIDKSIV